VGAVRSMGEDMMRERRGLYRPIREGTISSDQATWAIRGCRMSSMQLKVVLSGLG
jgi:hypothetical protein